MKEPDFVASRLDTALSGPPQLRPDEQRQFLGAFRERVSLVITVSQLRDVNCLKGFKQELHHHPNYRIIFNGHVDDTILTPYMQIANDHSMSFTIVSDEQYKAYSDSAGLVVVSDVAINVSPISIDQKYPQLEKPTTTTKTNLVDRLKRFFSAQ